MEFLELVKSRYSCKKFDGSAVTEEQLKAILESGRWAPTAKNLQEQHIYVIQSAEALAKVDEITPCRYNAGTVLAVAYDSANVYTYPGEKHTSGIEDAAIICTHMMLAAQACGVDSCWVNFFDPEAMAAALGLPENEDLVCLLDLGHAAEGAGPLGNHCKRKELAETVSYL